MALTSSGVVAQPKLAQVYALMDPSSATAFYVGVTTKVLHRRLGSHVHDGRHRVLPDDKCTLIHGLLARGIRPSIMLLEEVQIECWAETEQFWIEQLRALGCQLTNRSKGGPGSTGSRQSPEGQRNRSAAAQGRDMSHLHNPEVRERAAAMMRGRKGRSPTSETRAKMSAAKQGEKHNFYGKSPSAETREKIAAAHRGERSRLFGRYGADAQRSIPVLIDGVRYPSGRVAAAALGTSPNRIIRMIKQGKGEYLTAKT